MMLQEAIDKLKKKEKELKELRAERDTLKIQKTNLLRKAKKLSKKVEQLQDGADLLKIPFTFGDVRFQPNNATGTAMGGEYYEAVFMPIKKHKHSSDQGTLEDGTQVMYVEFNYTIHRGDDKTFKSWVRMEDMEQILEFYGVRNEAKYERFFDLETNKERRFSRHGIESVRVPRSVNV